MSLQSRLQRLEGSCTNDDIVVYSVFPNEIAHAKKEQAWADYVATGGRQLCETSLFVQINKIA